MINHILLHVTATCVFSYSCYMSKQHFHWLIDWLSLILSNKCLYMWFKRIWLKTHFLIWKKKPTQVIYKNFEIADATHRIKISILVYYIINSTCLSFKVGSASIDDNTSASLCSSSSDWLRLSSATVSYKPQWKATF